jgi:glycolate oxidase
MNDELNSLFLSLPKGTLVTDPDILLAYAHDEAALAHFELPRALARPKSADEAQVIVKFCAANNIPIVARGAGTGLSGGANATKDCIVVSFEAMNKIIKIDPDERIAIVQPGVVNDDLRDACVEFGLWYPPDPASAPWATIGGNVGTNAGGLCCVKYGVTRDYVLGLEAIVGKGEKVKLGRRTAKGVAGYDLTALFVGSEGTLGLVTEITLRLRSIRCAEKTIVAYFDDLPSAGRAAAAVSASGVDPSALELLDSFCLKAVDKFKNMGLADEGNVLLLARTDTPGEQGDIDADIILDCFEKSGSVWCARSSNETEAEALFAARRLVFPALKELGAVLTEDICVPRMNIAKMCARINEIAAAHDIYIACIAHAGDGNLHPLIVIPKDQPEAMARGAAALEEIVDEAISLGGTVTGEHGVGLLKMRGLAKEVGPLVLEMHRAIKKALDPANIFNPGKVF